MSVLASTGRSAAGSLRCHILPIDFVKSQKRPGGSEMRRWAEFVLRHRKWVVGFWLIVFIAGGALAGKTTTG